MPMVSTASRYDHGAQRAAKRSKYGGEPSWWNQRIRGDIVACCGAAHKRPRANMRRIPVRATRSPVHATPVAWYRPPAPHDEASQHFETALHQGQVAGEAAEELERTTVLDIGHVEGDRGRFTAAQHL